MIQGAAIEEQTEQAIRNLLAVLAAAVALDCHGQTALGVAGETDKRQADQEVDDGDHDADAEVVIIRVCQLTVGFRQVDQRDHRNERRVLEQRDEIVRHRRQRNAHGLRNDDVVKGLALGHAERQSALHLRAGNGHQSGAIVLGLISCVVDAEADDAGPEGRELQSDIGQTVEDEKQLDQHGRAADHFDVAGGDARQELGRKQPGHGEDQAEGDRQCHRAD